MNNANTRGYSKTKLLTKLHSKVTSSMLKEQKLNLYFPWKKRPQARHTYSAAHFLPVLCLVHHTRAADAPLVP